MTTLAQVRAELRCELGICDHVSTGESRVEVRVRDCDHVSTGVRADS